MSKPFPWSDWQAQHLARIEAYAAQIDILYQIAIREAATLATNLPANPNKPFRFADYPQANERLKILLQNLTLGIQAVAVRGSADAWENAEVKNDAMVTHLMQTGELSASLASRFIGARNAQAQAAFQTRTVGAEGLGLSQRVFKYQGQFKQELELGLGVGMAAGQSAGQLSQSIRQYLQNPDQLFRRVRNQRGQLVLSQAARVYHPGRGVYRSSYKNAMRLTRTEINQAYREADALRYQAMDFVVGVEVRRSNRGGVCPVCEKLKGRYPKTFVFRGWHPQCRCFVISILATPEELQQLNQIELNGGDTSGFRSVNQIEQPHQGWSDFINQNRDKLNAAPVKPLFITENKPFVAAVKPEPAKPSPFDELRNDELYVKALAEIEKRQQAGGLPAKLSIEEMAAVNNYTRSIYYNLNRWLRGGSASAIPNQARLEVMDEVLSTTLAKLPATKKTVYRILDLNTADVNVYKQALQNKTTVTFKAYTSTSLNPNIVFEGNVKMIIKSKRGRGIASMSQFPEEREVLFTKGATFGVTQVELVNGRTFIHLTEI
ncbi:ADP-ribosyltransferase [Fibrella sp. ES10-3-2-2]|nr:hypothetical protein A6C57_00220 [Fibrella sp. ES10-3-2-2]